MALKSLNLPKYNILIILPKEFEALGALQCALGPLGGQIEPPDGAHMQVKWPLGPSDFVSFRPKAQFDRPDCHLPTYERHRVVWFAPRGVQGRPGGLKNHQNVKGICELGGFRDLRGHSGPLACI